MMKKPILIISLALMLPGLVRAQEAFNSLSIGLEVGTTGIGVELAMPLVTDHLVLKGGLTAPSLSIPYSTTVDASGFNGMLDDVNSQLAASGVPDRIYSDFGNIGVDASAVLNLSSAKLLLEYYPFKKSSFHLVAGAYFGMGTGNLVSLRAQSDTRFLSDLNGLRAELDAINEKYASDPGYESIGFPEPAFNLCGTSYGIGEERPEGACGLPVRDRRMVSRPSFRRIGIRSGGVQSRCARNRVRRAYLRLPVLLSEHKPQADIQDFLIHTDRVFRNCRP